MNDISTRKKTITKNFSLTQSEIDMFNEVKRIMQFEIENYGLTHRVKDIDVMRNLMKKYLNDSPFYKK